MQTGCARGVHCRDRVRLWISHSEAEGLPDSSRWLRAAPPPDPRSQIPNRPWRGRRPLASLQDAKNPPNPSPEVSAKLRPPASISQPFGLEAAGKCCVIDELCLCNGQSHIAPEFLPSFLSKLFIISPQLAPTYTRQSACYNLNFGCL